MAVRIIPAARQKEILLGLADGMVTAVIDNENLDRHLAGGWSATLNIHLNAFTGSTE